MPLGYEESQLVAAAAERLSLPANKIKQVRLLKKSIDARKRDDITNLLSIEAVTLSPSEKGVPSTPYTYSLPTHSELRQRPVVVGSGPAGLFAAYTLAKAGACPILLERGMDVDSRKKSVDSFFGGGKLDSESNVQFGEGGAGTFSDGKLTTGIKNERLRKVLEIFVECGAPSEIMYDAKPHIGTDRLSVTVKNLREKIKSLGGEVRFSTRLDGLIIKQGAISGVYCTYNCDEKGENSRYVIECDKVILAVGHSARDTFEMLCESGVKLEPKPFSVGVRIEHLQKDINRAMYGAFSHNPCLGAADYKLAVHSKNGRGIYTFCMCPGGFVVAAASQKGGVVTNGMSLYARDAVNSNSALLVGVDSRDFSEGALDGMYTQRKLEEAAFKAGGENYYAPVFRADTLISGRESRQFGRVMPSYRPGVNFVPPKEFLPQYIVDALRFGLMEMGKRINGFDNPDSIMTGVESRSSSPVRITRDENMQSVSVKGLFPCGEGSGYAGGIASSAVDGITAAQYLLFN